MKINFSKFFLFGLAAIVLQNCNDESTESDTVEVTSASIQENSIVATDEIVSAIRWYSSTQLERGRNVFSQNCAVCHGSEAEGTVTDWKTRLADGSLAPPPLNGSAHAWHHPQEMLLRVINYGGESFGGNMPAFDDVLEESDKLAVIAYFQGFWSDEIYQQWMQMGGTN